MDGSLNLRGPHKCVVSRLLSSRCIDCSHCALLLDPQGCLCRFVVLQPIDASGRRARSPLSTTGAHKPGPICMRDSHVVSMLAYLKRTRAHPSVPQKASAQGPEIVAEVPIWYVGNPPSMRSSISICKEPPSGRVCDLGLE
jgi:hypothetical protein